jgi:hypothetical protein
MKNPNNQNKFFMLSFAAVIFSIITGGIFLGCLIFNIEILKNKKIIYLYGFLVALIISVFLFVIDYAKNKLSKNKMSSEYIFKNFALLFCILEGMIFLLIYFISNGL